jgi:hypothetical protein
MKNFKVLLYKTPKKFKFKYWVNYLISLRTWSPYSHIEIEDEDGICWTATMRGKENGSVSRPAREVVYNYQNWDYIQLRSTKSDYDAMLEYLGTEVKYNLGYSKWDILKFISPIHFPDSKRNICSELVNNALVVAGIYTGSGIIPLLMLLLLSGCLVIWHDNVLVVTFMKTADANDISMIAEPNYLEIGGSRGKTENDKIKLTTIYGIVEKE